MAFTLGSHICHEDKITLVDCQEVAYRTCNIFRATVGDVRSGTRYLFALLLVHSWLARELVNF
mgnify:CR=1 FL=1